jgi:adenylate cyclase
LQDEISTAIVDALQAKLVGDGSPRAGVRPARVKRHQPKPEVYELLLKARFFFTNETAAGLEAARSTIERALELDPDFATAHAFLSSCYTASFAYGMISSKEARAVAEPASRRALELDDELADALRASASVDAYLDWDFAAAEAKCRRAIELEPGSARAHRSLAMNALAPQGRLDEGVEALRTAYRLDPLQPVSSRNLAELLYWSGHYREALRQFEHTLVMEPSAPLPVARWPPSGRSWASPRGRSNCARRSCDAPDDTTTPSRWTASSRREARRRSTAGTFTRSKSAPGRSGFRP